VGVGTEIKLDYAFVADYAQVIDNKLTVVGASYTYVFTDVFPSTHMLSVAGRLRAPEGIDTVPLRIEVVPPNEAYTIGVDMELDHGPHVRPYDGKVGLLFAITMQVPLIAPGLYEVFLYVEGERVRRLAFEAQAIEQHN